MQCCGKDMFDWSHFDIPNMEENIPYFYCPRCNSHFYQDKLYNKEEWFFFINEEVYVSRQRQIAEEEQAVELESFHAHELINHSNPGELK